MKIKIHPLFYVIAIYFAIVGKVALFGGYILAIIIHEYSHICMATLRGYHLGDFVLMPYGGKVSGYTYNNYFDGIIVALSGPLANLLFSMIIMAFWWMIPNSYKYTIDLCRASIALGFVNMFPIFPLDGSQILFILSKNKLKIAKKLKVFSYLFGSLFILVTIISVFYNLNITIAVFGVFVILSTYFDKDRALYEYVNIRNVKTKNYDQGIKKIAIEILPDMMLYKLLGKISRNEIMEFIVKDKEENELGVIHESDLEKILLKYPINTKVIDVLEGKY